MALLVHDVPEVESGQRPHDLTRGCWCSPTVTAVRVVHHDTATTGHDATTTPDGGPTTAHDTTTEV